MPTRVSKDKNRSVTIEYEVRVLNGEGDSTHVFYNQTLDSAYKEAEYYISLDYPAVVIEEHISRMPAFEFDVPDSYLIVKEFGDKGVIGKWKGESTW